MICFGSNRMVIVGKRFVYKIPLWFRGVKANNEEYLNSLGKDYVAKTERKWYGLRQERLTDLVTLPLDYDGQIPAEWKTLWNLKLHNRFQIGKSSDGTWKFFDFEDVKFYANQNSKNKNNISSSRHR